MKRVVAHDLEPFELHVAALQLPLVIAPRGFDVRENPGGSFATIAFSS
jgi:hypothetical protein